MSITTAPKRCWKPRSDVITVVEGIFTHFANSDAADLDYSRLQLERFQQVLSFYDARGLPYPPLRHAANSGAIAQFTPSHLDMVRGGILLYGVYPSPISREPLMFILRWPGNRGWSTSRWSSRSSQLATGPPGKAITWYEW
ncbi:MAG: alanine racemase [Chloroflexota bacterium]